MKALITYFSCSGVTKRVAQVIADVTNGNLVEIKPAVPYTAADLNWNDINSRSSVEMKDQTSRPAIIKDIENIESYDVIFLGFPIWWYVAPTIINTFLESYDLTGKTIVPFATSGGSGAGKTNDYLKQSCETAAKLYPTTIINGTPTKSNLAQWLDDLKL